MRADTISKACVEEGEVKAFYPVRCSGHENPVTKRAIPEGSRR